MDKLLIIGIDPGTVSAYAILDLDGRIMDIGSSRQLSHGDLILKLIKHGKVVIIGSDVHPCPNLTLSISKKLGARIISPDHDLKYLEKIRLVDRFLKTKKEYVEINNKHERDALAAALYGFNHTKNLIKRIDDFLRQNNKKHLFNEVRDKVLLENKPIAEVFRMFS